MHGEQLPAYADDRPPAYGDGSSSRSNGKNDSAAAYSTSKTDSGPPPEYSQTRPQGDTGSNGSASPYRQEPSNSNTRNDTPANNNSRNGGSTNGNTRSSTPANGNAHNDTPLTSSSRNGNPRTAPPPNANARNDAAVNSASRTGSPANGNARDNAPGGARSGTSPVRGPAPQHTPENRNQPAARASSPSSTNGHNGSSEVRNPIAQHTGQTVSPESLTAHTDQTDVPGTHDQTAEAASHSRPTPVATQDLSAHAGRPSTRPPLAPRTHSSDSDIADGSTSTIQRPAANANPFRTATSGDKTGTAPATWGSNNPYRDVIERGQDQSTRFTANGTDSLRPTPDSVARATAGPSQSVPLSRAGDSSPISRTAGPGTGRDQGSAGDIKSTDLFRRPDAGMVSKTSRSGEDPLSQIATGRRGPAAQARDIRASDVAQPASKPLAGNPFHTEGPVRHTDSESVNTHADELGADLPVNSHLSFDRSGEPLVNQCGRQVLERLAARYPGSRITPPQVSGDLHGMGAAEFQAGATGRLQTFFHPGATDIRSPAEGYATIAGHIRRLGKGAGAAVVQSYRGATDRYGIGAHAIQLVHRGNGAVMVWDPALSTTHEVPLDFYEDFVGDRPDIAAVTAVVYVPTGEPTEIPGHDTLGVDTVGAARIGSTTLPGSDRAASPAPSSDTRQDAVDRPQPDSPEDATPGYTRDPDQAPANPPPPRDADTDTDFEAHVTDGFSPNHGLESALDPETAKAPPAYTPAAGIVSAHEKGRGTPIDHADGLSTDSPQSSRPTPDTRRDVIEYVPFEDAPPAYSSYPDRTPANPQPPHDPDTASDPALHVTDGFRPTDDQTVVEPDTKAPQHNSPTDDHPANLPPTYDPAYDAHATDGFRPTDDPETVVEPDTKASGHVPITDTSAANTRSVSSRYSEPGDTAAGNTHDHPADEPPAYTRYPSAGPVEGGITIGPRMPAEPHGGFEPPQAPPGFRGAGPVHRDGAAWWEQHGQTWWRGLGFEHQPIDRQRDLLTGFPGLRNGEGIPAPVRDQLNRTHLQLEIERYRNTPGLRNTRTGQARWSTLVNIHAAMTSADHETTSAGPSVYLLAVGDDHAIIGLGPVDTATTVAWHVPNHTSAGSSLHNMADTMIQAAHQQARTTPGPDHAIVVQASADLHQRPRPAPSFDAARGSQTQPQSRGPFSGLRTRLNALTRSGGPSTPAPQRLGGLFSRRVSQRPDQLSSAVNAFIEARRAPGNAPGGLQRIDVFAPRRLANAASEHVPALVRMHHAHHGATPHDTPAADGSRTRPDTPATGQDPSHSSTTGNAPAGNARRGRIGRVAPDTRMRADEFAHPLPDPQHNTATIKHPTHAHEISDGSHTPNHANPTSPRPNNCGYSTLNLARTVTGNTDITTDHLPKAPRASPTTNSNTPSPAPTCTPSPTTTPSPKSSPDPARPPTPSS